MSNTIFLELDDVPGSSVHQKFPKQIMIDSFSYGSSNAVTWPVISSTRRTSGKAVSGEISLNKSSDLSTCALHLKCLAGTNIKKGKISVGTNTGTGGAFVEVLTYSLENVLIVNMSTSGSGGTPNDSFSLNYSKISVAYSEQGKDTVAGGKGSYVYDAATVKVST